MGKGRGSGVDAVVGPSSLMRSDVATVLLGHGEGGTRRFPVPS